MSKQKLQADQIAERAYFYFKRVNGVEDLHNVFALRYQVYCKECGFLPAADYPDGKETDEYDAYSLHFSAFHHSGTLAGAVRLVRATPEGLFPFHQHCPSLYAGVELPPAAQAAEISRLVVGKDFRRRLNDTLFGFQAQESPTVEVGIVQANGQRRTSNHPEIVLGLYREMYQESKRQGITHWYAAMERSLARLLMRYKFSFVPIGPEVDYYGPVTPYLASLADLEEKVSRCNPELFAWFSSPD